MSHRHKTELQLVVKYKTTVASWLYVYITIVCARSVCDSGGSRFFHKTIFYSSQIEEGGHSSNIKRYICIVLQQTFWVPVGNVSDLCSTIKSLATPDEANLLSVLLLQFPCTVIKLQIAKLNYRHAVYSMVTT